MPQAPEFEYPPLQPKLFSSGCRSVVEWLKRRTYDQHGLGLKPTHAVLLCPGERHFTALFPAWWS